MKTKKNYLEMIPVRNKDYLWNIDGKGCVVVDMPHKSFYDKIAQKLFHTPSVSHITLDRFGSFIWMQIDGNRDLIEIGSLVKQKYGEKAEPLYERLARYFDILKNNHFITMKNN